MRRAFVLAVAVVAMLGTSAHAQRATELLNQAEAQWNDQEYERVIALADEALATVSATPRERIEALRLKGSAFVVLDKQPEAEAAFDQLFAIDPEYEMPPKTAQRILAVFGPARAKWLVTQEERLATELGPALAALKMTVELPHKPRGGRPLTIGVHIVDPQAIADSIVLSQRRAGAGFYTTSTLPAKQGTVSLTIPAEATASPTDYTLELHVQARHRSGVTLRREGRPDNPLQLAVLAGDVPAPATRPVWKRGWFWASVGGAALLAVGGALYFTRDVGPQGVEFTR